MHEQRPAFDSLPLSSPSPHMGVTATAQWTARRIMLATLTVVGVALIFLLLYRFYMIVFLFFVAISLQIAIEPAVAWLFRHGIPKKPGVIIVYTLLLVCIGLLIWFVAPPIIEQAQAVAKDLPQYYQAGRAVLLESSFGLLRGIGMALPAQPSWLVQAALSGAAAPADAPAPGWQFIQVAGRTLFALFAIFALAFYWTQEGDVILRKLVLQAPVDQRTELRALIAEIQVKIGSYFRGQFILCVIVGAFSTLAFLLIGVPNAFLLGLLMGIFEAIPIIGPTLGAVPAILMTLAVVPERTLWVIAALVFIQAAENNFLVPKIMDRSVGVNAVVSMLAIAAFGALFGLAGAILAIPMAAIIQIFLNRILFSTTLTDEAPVVAPEAGEVSRSYVGVLRLEAQHLVQAVRQQVRNEPNGQQPDDESAQTEDEIEALAADLDSALADMENNA